MPADDAEPPASSKHDSYAALRSPAFRRYLPGNVLAIAGMQMQTVAVFWEVYRRTGSKAAIGWVGVALFLPRLLLMLPAGQLADRFERKRVIAIGLTLAACASLGMAVVSALELEVWLMYPCLVLAGVATTVQQPAKASFLPSIVPREAFNNAIAWNMGGFHTAAAVGPALTGLILWLSGHAQWVFLLDVAAAMTFLALLRGVPSPPQTVTSQAVTMRTVTAGLDYVWHHPVILGAIALDMFAVLLGGATALFAVFAKDILEVDDRGLGLMQAAPAVGSLLMSFSLAHRPPLERAGKELLLAVAGFGLATIAFGLSRNFVLSLVMLLLTGVFDSISVVVRHSLVQLLTPDWMRGRVSAVNGLFIGASNELGAAESGFVAGWIGPVATVALGGVGTILVAGIAAWRLPQLRRYGRLGGEQEPASALAASPLIASALVEEAAAAPAPFDAVRQLS